MIALALLALLLVLGAGLAGGAKGVAIRDANRQCGGYW